MDEIYLWLLVALGVLGTLAAAGFALRQRRQRQNESQRAAQRAAAEIEAGRVQAERLEAARLEAERAQSEQAQARRVQAAQRATEQAAAERRDAERREAEALAAAQRAEARRFAAERAAADLRAAQAAVQQAAAARDLVERKPAAAPRAAKAAAETTILVADDSKVVRIKTGRLLAQHGYRVNFAVDGTDAAQQLRAAVPDLVITDVEMPGLDGFELTRHIRDNPSSAHVPVIMITAADARHRAQADAVGVSVLLGKPYEDDALLARVREAVLGIEEPAIA